jgi:hypothetical protein
MNAGKYLVTFEVDFDNEGSHEEAVEAVREMLVEMIDQNEFPEIDFHLIEELDTEYQTEENEVEELNFEQVV